ncbi:hypothetical protein B0H11DRAFT_2244788 [Mycena galericulata]|nr:hypothetical protein B0H11DRAFT_2244788 [Mycena galericulata]
MCDAISTLKSSAIFWVLSLLPGAIVSYIGFALTCASLGIYILHRQRPSEKLDRLEDAIKFTEEILKRAQTSSGARQFTALLNLEGRLWEAKLAASKIQTRILEAGEDETWNEYLHTLRRILQSIDDCARKVGKIRKETLLAMENARQRQISENIKESHEVEATARAPIRRLSPRRGSINNHFGGFSMPIPPSIIKSQSLLLSSPLHRLAMSTLDVRASFAELLPRASLYPCSALTERILVSFILFAPRLYAPLLIAINPFKSVLFLTSLKVRGKALALASEGGVSPDQPFVCVLWKILKIGPYSPNTPARSSCPKTLEKRKYARRHIPAVAETILTTHTTASRLPAKPTPKSASSPPKKTRATPPSYTKCASSSVPVRVILSLAAQRRLAPLLPAHATSALISLPDLAPLVAHNPALAHRPFVALHSSSSTSASSSGPYSSSSSSSCASPYSSSANVHTTSTPPPYLHPHPQTPPYLAELAALPISSDPPKYQILSFIIGGDRRRAADGRAGIGTAGWGSEH